MHRSPHTVWLIATVRSHKSTLGHARCTCTDTLPSPSSSLISLSMMWASDERRPPSGMTTVPWVTLQRRGKRPQLRGGGEYLSLSAAASVPHMQHTHNYLKGCIQPVTCFCNDATTIIKHAIQSTFVFGSWSRVCTWEAEVLSPPLKHWLTAWFAGSTLLTGRKRWWGSPLLSAPRSAAHDPTCCPKCFKTRGYGKGMLSLAFNVLLCEIYAKLRKASPAHHPLQNYKWPFSTIWFFVGTNKHKYLKYYIIVVIFIIILYLFSHVLCLKNSRSRSEAGLVWIQTGSRKTKKPNTTKSS